jgi:uncharacterized protein
MVFWKNKKIQIFIIILLMFIVANGIVIWKSGFLFEKHDIDHNNPLINDIGNGTHKEPTSENTSFKIPTQLSNDNWDYPNNYYSQNTHYKKSKIDKALVNVPKMEVLISGTGGDVVNNTIIKKYVPVSPLTSQVFDLAKHGTPIIIFGDGSYPRVMISAGIHGHELPAQIASIKLINYLSHTPIKGTIYIVPFVVPSSSTHNIRLWNGMNLNSVANINGTPSNILVKKAKSLDIVAFGDFHSTQPGAVPGRDSILCTKLPTYESFIMANYISQKSKSELISEDIAGESYPGAVEDNASLVGIPTVTCEVLSPHGIATPTTIQKSLNQMITLLKYTKTI